MIASGRALACAGALALALASTATASAGAPEDSEITTARALYREAVLLERQGRLGDARARLEAAYRTVRTPVLGLALGRVQARLGHLVAAYDVLRAVDAIPADPHETDKGRDARREAATLAASVRDRVGLLRVAAPADLAGSVTVDGAALDDGATTLIDPGAHSVALASAGRECASVVVSVREGESRVLDLRDRAGGCRAPAAAIATPSPDPEPAPAPPKLAAPPPSAPASSSRWAALGLVGGGGLAAAIAGYVSLRARSDYDSVAGQCSGTACSPEAFNVRESARARAAGAAYVIGVGLATAAVGVTIWVVEESRASVPSRRVGVALSPSGVALTLVQ